MKFRRTLPFLLVLLASQLAAAQGPGYYSQPAPTPGGFHNRAGRLMFGGSLGLGGMRDNGSGVTNCDNCRNGLAVELDGHIGGMLNPRFGLMFEGQLNGRTVHSNVFDADTILTQSAAMIAGQYWITPMLWVKGGIGFANLRADDAYVIYDYGSGLAILGAVGFELMSARYFSLDLQGRLIDGAYNSGTDHVTSLSVGLGINWY